MDIEIEVNDNLTAPIAGTGTGTGTGTETFMMTTEETPQHTEDIMDDEPTPAAILQHSDIELNSDVSSVLDDDEDNRDVLIDDMLDDDMQPSQQYDEVLDVDDDVEGEGNEDEDPVYSSPMESGEIVTKDSNDDVTRKSIIDVDDGIEGESELEYESDEVSIEPVVTQYEDQETLDAHEGNEEEQDTQVGANNELITTTIAVTADDEEVGTETSDVDQDQEQEVEPQYNDFNDDSELEEEKINEKEEQYYDQEFQGVEIPENDNEDDQGELDGSDRSDESDGSKDDNDSPKPNTVDEHLVVVSESTALKSDNAEEDVLNYSDKEEDDNDHSSIFELPVYIDLGDEIYKLFTPINITEADDFRELPSMFNLESEIPSILSQPLDRFFTTVRKFMVDHQLSFKVNEELALVFKNLKNLTVNEDNLFNSKLTLQDLLRLFISLRDNCLNKDLFKFAQIEIITSPRFICQFSSLLKQSQEGIGLEAIDRDDDNGNSGAFSVSVDDAKRTIESIYNGSKRKQSDDNDDDDNDDGEIPLNTKKIKTTIM
ncbi:hypothetical protein CANARDRAFT_213894 [[Candida] arabinofermentans NRRL YB-2248]|uniref:Uncharacterized protein n=1 Tax=[Candida] arabinofermentans NRRL YB-2248 TaxID=983967 RepID=A0A1E4SWY8_9ASCO|nr:hypothetical protein CANARDRAFT_213894 [[Candida] arabinofermentans NRRL YB-2248]